MSLTAFLCSSDSSVGEDKRPDSRHVKMLKTGDQTSTLPATDTKKAKTNPFRRKPRGHNKTSEVQIIQYPNGSSHVKKNNNKEGAGKKRSSQEVPAPARQSSQGSFADTFANGFKQMKSHHPFKKNQKNKKEQKEEASTQVAAVPPSSSARPLTTITNNIHSINNNTGSTGQTVPTRLRYSVSCDSGNGEDLSSSCESSIILDNNNTTTLQQQKCPLQQLELIVPEEDVPLPDEEASSPDEDIFVDALCNIMSSDDDDVDGNNGGNGSDDDDEDDEFATPVGSPPSFSGLENGLPSSLPPPCLPGSPYTHSHTQDTVPIDSDSHNNDTLTEDPSILDNSQDNTLVEDHIDQQNTAVVQSNDSIDNQSNDATDKISLSTGNGKSYSCDNGNDIGNHGDDTGNHGDVSNRGDDGDHSENDIGICDHVSNHGDANGHFDVSDHGENGIGGNDFYDYGNHGDTDDHGDSIMLENITDSTGHSPSASLPNHPLVLTSPADDRTNNQTKSLAMNGITRANSTPSHLTPIPTSTSESLSSEEDLSPSIFTTSTTSPSTPLTPSRLPCCQLHPLCYNWVLWYDKLTTGRPQFSDYAAHLKNVSSIASVEEFWSVFNNLLPPSQLAKNANYHFFKEGVKPLWEDPANKKGGKWVITFKNSNSLLDKVWLEVLMALVGEQINESHQITGLVLSRRKKGDRIALWTANKSKTLNLTICKQLLRVLGLACGTNGGYSFEKFVSDLAEDRGGFNMVYTLHKDSLKSGTSYQNEAHLTLKENLKFMTTRSLKVASR